VKAPLTEPAAIFLVDPEAAGRSGPPGRQHRHGGHRRQIRPEGFETHAREVLVKARTRRIIPFVW
jgi:hypothetical protein